MTTQLNNKIYKFFKTKAVSIDEAKKTIRFRISDNKPDRMGEIVDQQTWDFKSYKANPLVLWGHKSEEPEHVLGTGMDLETTPDGSETYATLQLDEDINPKAALVWKQLVKGTLRCVSVGFIPHTMEWLDDDPVLKDNELLEISIVPIPANPRAVALDFKAGAISRKDANWLIKSMRDEAELIEKQLEVAPKSKEKSMTEDQAAQMLEGMTKLTEKVDTLATENAALKTQLAELKPVAETDEEKTAREATEKEAADKAAADKLEAEKAAEEARKAEDAKNNGDGTDPAKGGNTDQPGATDGKIDDDTELTDELAAQIDAALAASHEPATV